MANIASKCEFDYGSMGAVGFNYESVKDNLKWNRLKVKRYIYLLMRVGNILALNEKEYSRQKVGKTVLSNDDIANILKSAFGDGR